MAMVPGPGGINQNAGGNNVNQNNPPQQPAAAGPNAANVAQGIFAAAIHANNAALMNAIIAHLNGANIPAAGFGAALQNIIAAPAQSDPGQP